MPIWRILTHRPAYINTARLSRGWPPAHHIVRTYRRARTFSPVGEHQVARPSTRFGFEIAVICALPLEADAVDAVFDLHWDDEGPPFDKAAGDPNAYSTGVIGRHNVVLAHMPGMGKASAAAVAAHCRASFPNIRLALLVGVCGVVPFGPDGEQIALGDVIISDGVVQYDFGRRNEDRFVRKDTLVDSLGRPSVEIRAVLAKLKGLRGRKMLGGKMAGYLDHLQLEPGLCAEPPETAGEKGLEASAEGASSVARINRTLQDGRKPNIHFGLIASGDSVIKSGKDRDALAAAEGVIAFEMEGAGVWENLPCVVIKGACDYADSYKNKDWQRYAASAAAACMKAFVSYWVPSSAPSTMLGQDFSQKRTVGVHCIPYPKNRDFVERKEETKSVEDTLFAEDGRCEAALVGLGGIGKTQLALHLAHHVKDTKPEYSVLWIAAFSMSSYEEGCTEVLSAFDVRCSEKDDAKEILKNHLSSDKAGKWFLIIDNADDTSVMDEILDHLPQSEHGRILFTTRSQEVAVSAAGSAVIRLPEMSQDEALTFLETSLIDKSQIEDETLVEELLEKLTNLPLAIAQAAAYMNMNQIPIGEYLRLFNNTDQDTIELLSARFRNSTHYFHTQGAIATTWIISFNQISERNPHATRLLAQLSCFEPKAIPRSIMPSFDTEQKLTSSVGVLCGYGFLVKRGGEGMYDMHPLVHLATRIWSERQPDSDQVREELLQHIRSVYPPTTWEYRDQWRQYLPHVLKIIKARRGIGWDYYYLAIRVVSSLRFDGRLHECFEVLHDGMAMRDELAPEEDPYESSWNYELAVAHLHNYETDEAIKLLEPIDSPDEEDEGFRLIVRHSLASAYLMRGQLEKALELQNSVVRAREAGSTDVDVNLITSKCQLAMIYNHLGQDGEAIGLLEPLIPIKETTLAMDHPDRLLVHDRLAFLYLNTGQVREATKLLELETKLHQSADEREAFFMENVAEGENIMGIDERTFDSAIAFFKALKVYPNIDELLAIYSKTIPQAVMHIINEMVDMDEALQIQLEVERSAARDSEAETED